MNRQTIIYVLVFLAGVFVGAVAFGATPQAAAALAVPTLENIPVNRTFHRTIWNESGSKEDKQALTIAVNTALNHSAQSYIPPEVVGPGGESLLVLDFTKFSDDPKEIHRLLEVWDRLAVQDKFFHEQFVVKGGKTTVRPAFYLHETGAQLESLATGGVTKLNLPIAYGPWIHVKMLSSVDGGAYLQFRGLTPGKTKLEEYLTSRGASFEVAKKLNAVERLGLLSQVTGKARGINYYQGQGVRPTAGRPLVFITDDIFSDNVNANSDPFHSLLASKPDGHEVFVVLPNGWIEFTLFNGDGILVAEAPMGSPKFLVADHRYREPFDPRLHGALCMRCHGPFDMFQPAQNEVASRLRKFGVQSTALTGDKHQQFVDLRRIGFIYQAKQFEIDSVLQDARDGFDKRVYEVTGIDDPHAAKIGCELLTRLYMGYENEWVNAKLALERAGVQLHDRRIAAALTAMMDDDYAAGVIEAYDHRQAIRLMEILSLPENPELYDPAVLSIVQHLGSTTEVYSGGKKTEVPLKIHPRQFEAVFATLCRRLEEVRE